MEQHLYPQEKITVVWQPKKCIHSGVCVKTLPKEKCTTPKNAHG